MRGPVKGVNMVLQRSKLFTSPLENNQRSRDVLKIGKIESVNAEHCKFKVGSGNSASTFYQVHICSLYIKQRMKDLRSGDCTFLV